MLIIIFILKFLFIFNNKVNGNSQYINNELIEKGFI
jgi:hypothetical protein